MTLVMAEKDQPVFRDFLGLDRGSPLSKQQQQQQTELNTSTVDVVRGASRSSGTAFDSQGDVETFATRASSGTTGRFETSSAPGYISPASCLALPSSSDPCSVGWQRCNTASSLQHHGIRSAFCKPGFEGSHVSNKRDYSGTRDSLQERLQMSVQAIENSRPPQKMPRFDQQKVQKYEEIVPSLDDLRLSMQPPRLSSVSPPWLQQQPTNKPAADACNRTATMKQLEGPKLLQHSNSSGLQLPRISHLGACAEREERAAAAVVSSRDNNSGMSPPITRPAADEGSRTGLKGSPFVGLINNPATPVVPAGSNGPPPLLPWRPMNSNLSGGSEPTLPPTRQGTPPASRQLTIFYGGQAHVFDEVPSDKAEAILALAGSHGKSWSTTYSPRPAASIPDSASEGSLSVLEKEKAVQSLGGSATGGRSLPLSTDVQTLVLRGFASTGNGTGCST